MNISDESSNGYLDKKNAWLYAKWRWGGSVCSKHCLRKPEYTTLAHTLPPGLSYLVKTKRLALSGFRFNFQICLTLRDSTTLRGAVVTTVLLNPYIKMILPLFKQLKILMMRPVKQFTSNVPKEEKCKFTRSLVFR